MVRTVDVVGEGQRFLVEIDVRLGGLVANVGGVRFEITTPWCPTSSRDASDTAAAPDTAPRDPGRPATVGAEPARPDADNRDGR
jgi:hypothetical protein